MARDRARLRALPRPVTADRVAHAVGLRGEVSPLERDHGDSRRDERDHREDRRVGRIEPVRDRVGDR